MPSLELSDHADEGDQAQRATVCRLPVGDRMQRTADFRALFSDTFVDRVRVGDGVRWTLRASDATEAESRRLAALEERCCDGIRFEVVRDDDAVAWRISGPPSAGATLDAFYELPVQVSSDAGADALWSALDAAACGPPGGRRDTMSSMEVRAAEAVELDQLAQLWYDGWRDAHLLVVPAELARMRTLESFRERLQAALADVRVVGPVGAPVGFSIVKGDELYQLFVSAPSRGSGVAAVLIDDAEAQLAAKGVETAWLACAIGNERAARFYEKRGWRRAGTVISQLDTPDGNFPLEVWRYEKLLSRAGS
jgi:GNAT superfamily N-acetyltransferase